MWISSKMDDQQVLYKFHCVIKFQRITRTPKSDAITWHYNLSQCCSPFKYFQVQHVSIVFLQSLLRALELDAAQWWMRGSVNYCWWFLFLLETQGHGMHFLWRNSLRLLQSHSKSNELLLPFATNESKGARNMGTLASKPEHCRV